MFIIKACLNVARIYGMQAHRVAQGLRTGTDGCVLELNSIFIGHNMAKLCELIVLCLIDYFLKNI